MLGGNPDNRVGRRFVLAATASGLAIPLAAACGQEVDRKGLVMEATATTQARALSTATPAGVKPATFHERMLVQLKPGQKIDIWDGTFRFDNEISRRPTDLIPARESTSGEGWSCECRPGPSYKPSLGKHEVVVNPLRVKGTFNDGIVGGRVTTSQIDGFAYIAPETGQFVWVGIVPDDTDYYIHTDGLKLSTIRPIRRDSLKQTAIIESVASSDSLNRPLVRALKENGRVEPLMGASLSKILGIF